MTAKLLADLLDYDEMHQILKEFHVELLRNLTTFDMLKIRIRETRCAKKRLRKYEKKMRKCEKALIKEYKDKKLFKFEFGSRVYSAYDTIVFDENIIFSEK